MKRAERKIAEFTETQKAKEREAEKERKREGRVAVTAADGPRSMRLEGATAELMYRLDAEVRSLIAQTETERQTLQTMGERETKLRERTMNERDKIRRPWEWRQADDGQWVREHAPGKQVKRGSRVRPFLHIFTPAGPSSLSHSRLSRTADRYDPLAHDATLFLAFRHIRSGG